jgi:DnaJ-class molecular chaperone
MQYEICNVTEQVTCNSCMGRGGDFDMAGNSFNSYCGVCNGKGYETRQVTRKRGYVVYNKNSDENKNEGD